MYDYTYYDYGYGYQSSDVTTGLATLGGVIFVFWLIAIALSVFSIICMWKVFKKAGKPGWASIIPIYNIIVMLEIAELPLWYIALFFVPIANIYAMFKIYIEIAHKFGKSTGFGVGMALIPIIFIAILAFDKSANYVGIQVQQPMNQSYVQPVQPMNQSYAQPVQPMDQSYAQPVQPIDQSYAQPVQPTIQPEVSQTVTPAFCTNCGSALLPNSKFCTNCGKQI